jgi:hypothetical protein
MNSFFQPSKAASIQKPSVLNGTKVCKGCTHSSSVYKHGHDLTCPKSDYFGMTQKQKSDAIKEKKRMQALKKPPSSEAPNHVAWQKTALGEGFFRQQSTGSTAVLVNMDTVSPATSATTATTMTIETTEQQIVTIASTTTETTGGETTRDATVATTTSTTIHDEAVSVDTIKRQIEQRLGPIQKGFLSAKVRNPYRKKGDNKDDQSRWYSAPAQIVALVGYLLSLVPSKTEASERATATSDKLAFYKRLFPPGTMSFAVPKGDRTKPLD